MIGIQPNFLQSLISAGNDAFSNLFKVSFYLGKFSKENTEALTVRCKGFTVPALSQDSYQVKYMNTKLDRPVAKANVERHFSVTFRVDSNFEVYKKLLEQQAVTFDITNDYTGIDVTSDEINKKLFNVKVESDSSEEKNNTGITFYFYNCWITDITPTAWSTDNSAPLEVTVGINYLEGLDINA